MNKKQIESYQMFSIFFVLILGILLHFTYKLSGENKFVAWFSATNESVFEHLKLVFFPMLLSIIIGYFYVGKNNSSFLCAKTLGVIFAMAFIVIFFYTYTGILGYNIAIIDIASFFIATIAGEYLAYILTIKKIKCNKKLAIIILLIIASSFIYFTYHVPELGLFKDPTII